MSDRSLDQYRQKRDTDLHGSNYGQSSDTITHYEYLLKYFNSKSYIKNNPHFISLLIEDIQKNPVLVKKANNNPEELISQLEEGLLDMLLTRVTSAIRSREVVPSPPQQQQTIHSPRDLLDPIPQTYSNKQDSFTPHPPNHPQQSSNGNAQQFNGQQSQDQIGNVLPDLDALHYVEYNVSLDMCNMGDVNNPSRSNKFISLFDKISSISKICLKSFIIERNSIFENEPYIYVKLAEFKGKCYISGTIESFGKLVVSKIDSRYIHYVPDTGTCIQIFKTPINLNVLTLSFLNKHGKLINPREIQLLEIEQENDVITLFTKYTTHGLKVSNEYTIDIHNGELTTCSLSPSEIKPDSIVFEGLQDFEIHENAKVKLYNDNIEASCVFAFSEINWPLIKSPTPEDTLIINLNNLIKGDG